MKVQNFFKCVQKHISSTTFNIFVTVCFAILLFCFSEVKAQNFEFDFDLSKFQVNGNGVFN